MKLRTLILPLSRQLCFKGSSVTLYSQSARATFILDREGQSALAEAVATIPGEWIRSEGPADSEMKKRITNRLADMFKASESIIKSRLEILNGLPEETAADARALSRRNSVAFQLKHCIKLRRLTGAKCLARTSDCHVYW